MKLSAISENHLLLEDGNDIVIERYFLLQEVVRKLKEGLQDDIIAVNTSYTAIQIEVSNSLEAIKKVERIVEQVTDTFELPQEVECLEIPVCYEEPYSLDREEVTRSTGLTWDEIVEIHSEGHYLTFFIGFTLGFPYLAGMDLRLATPRKETPRVKIEKGCVGIANNQTGVYTVDSPGGWQIIGRSPVEFYSIAEERILLDPGLIVKFKPISVKEYENYVSEGYQLKRSVIKWPFK